MRTIKNITSKVKEEMDKYIQNLKDLQRSLADASSVGAYVMIHRIAADMVEHGEVLKDIGRNLSMARSLFNQLTKQHRC